MTEVDVPEVEAEAEVVILAVAPEAEADHVGTVVTGTPVVQGGTAEIGIPDREETAGIVISAEEGIPEIDEGADHALGIVGRVFGIAHAL